MTDTFRQRIERWDGDSVVVSFDRPTGTWIFIALHDMRLGFAVGGTRVNTYSSPVDGLVDALRLGEGMTYKWAGIGIPFGGGKAVLATPGPLSDEDRNGLLERYGVLLASLRGTFRTGVDLGTTPKDLLRVDQGNGYVIGVADGHSEDPGPFTALGVFGGIRASVSHRFDSDEFTGRSVLIQGVGDVGLPLAELLAAQGVKLYLSDIDGAVARNAAERLGGQVVEPDDVYGTEVDVYAPCAIGATINPDTLPRLRCAIVAGSANNQLLTENEATGLHERGILYAPDYIINAGGAMAFAGLYQGVTERDELNARVATIEDSLRAIFVEASVADESPLLAARRLAERYLQAGQAGGDAAAERAL